MSNPHRGSIGSLERLLRALVGIAAVALVFTGPRTAWGYLGLIPLLTAAAGFCPLYAVLGISTRRKA